MSKVRPVIPPKPARLSMSSKKRDTTYSANSTPTPTSTTFSEEPMTESPPSTLPASPNGDFETAMDDNDDRTPRASEVMVGRQARALYNFEGEASYQELSFKAGDVLNVLNENLSEGWSLAEKNGIIGLVPKSYITVSIGFPRLFCHNLCFVYS